MPSPRPDEDHDSFMDRCMSDPEARESFPEQDQRAAFCESQFENKEEEGGEGMAADKRERLRAATEGRLIGVDREQNAILGYVVAQEGPFKSEGRGEFDGKSLRQIVKLIKTRKLGVKSRFSHPTLSDDGLGKFLGRVKGPYLDKILKTGEDGEPREIEVVRGDLHFDPTALYTAAQRAGGEPKPATKPLGEYVMELAESDPDALSSSLVLATDQEYRLDKKGRPLTDDTGRELPPLWRPTAIYGSDIVDEGDAVDGLLSAQLDIDGLPDAALRRGCELLDKHFAGKSREFIRERCGAWLERYLTRRFGAESIVVPYDPARDPRKVGLKRKVEEWKKGR